MDGPRDNFKWFGEGFDGFPRYLPEDCVEYALYIIDPKLDDFGVRAKLREVQSRGTKLTHELLEGFIWQRESFSLDLVREIGGVRSFLRGRTCYGDSVEDEWLIVYMLRELSKSFPHLWIRVVDTDGQFLLIEAADALPRWLNPEIADFRVWINNSKLLIIPNTLLVEGDQNIQAAQRPQARTLEEALESLQNSQSKLLHLPLVETEAFYRLEKYPMQIADSLHHALVRLPRKLAYILHDKAAYISPAIESFYLRDPIATRLLYASDSTKRIFSPTDLVTVSVTFTKVGYAQLKSQRFAAPPAWSDTLSTNHDPKSQNRAETGMKLTCGFEILMSDPQNKDLKVFREIKLLLQDIETGEDHLPSDSEIAKWRPEDEDDEAWLNIDFTQFEKELAGKGSRDLVTNSEGFGDKIAQENLRKMVARFENFLSDNAAGAEGAEYLDEMDEDNDDDHEASDTGSRTDGDEEEIAFKEDNFATMMKEVMGIPDNETTDSSLDSASRSNLESTDDEGEGDRIRQVMRDMELELHDAGALRLNRTSVADEMLQPSKTSDAGTRGLDRPSRVADEESDTDNEALDIDYNLAKNLLESFKSQGGGAGPGGNLMGLMGMQMPRDEEDSFPSS